MPAMPAFCDTCGTIFSSGIFLDNCRGTTLQGCMSGPCPKCGGMGHIPDGVYDVIGNVVNLISGAKRSYDELNKLASILKAAQKSNSSREEVTRQINNEVPELSSLASYLPKTRNEFYAFLTLIITALTFMMTTCSNQNNSTLSESQVQQMIEHTIERSITQPTPQTMQQQPTRPNQQWGRKVGRNEQCPCGSGKKYKKCCLQLI